MGIPIISTLSRQGGANFPIALAEDIIGAFCVVADTTARDAIPTAILRTGAVIRIGSTSTYYQWNGAAWVAYAFGSGDIRADGSIPFAANQSMGGNKLTNVGNGTTGSQDAAPVAQVEALIAAAVAGAGGGGGDGFAFTFSTSTADADPGAGTLRINSATPGVGMTQIFVDLADTSSNDITAWLDRLDDSIGSVKGYVRVGSKSDKTKWLLFSLQSVTTATGYRKLGVTYVAGPALPLTTAGDCFLSFESMGLIGLITNALIDPSANIAWSKLATAIGNLAFTGLKLLSYTGEVDNGNSGAADTIDLSAGALQKSTLTANCTYTITNSAIGTDYRLKVIQDATGGRTVTWPSTISGKNLVWIGGSAPVVDATANAVTFVSFYDDGTVVWGSVAGVADGGFPWAKMAAASARGQSPVWNGSAWVFFGVATKSANLTDANATVTVTDGNRMVLAAATLTASRNLTLGVTGSPTDKEIITVERYDTTANTYVVKSNGGTDLYTFPASVKRMASFQYQAASTDWILVSHVAITS